MSADRAREPPALTPEDWERFLSERLGARVTVSYGRSRTAPLLAHRPRRSREETAAWRVRMHSMFAAAPLEVRSGVAELLAPGRRPRGGGGTVLRDWIDATLEKHPRPRIPDERLRAQGRCHDLARIAGSLLESELRGDFGAGRPVPRITWARAGPRPPRRVLRLGSYDVESHVVRIHPALDQPAVPEWFLRYTLFHEFLHAIHPPVRGRDGRWIRHGAELVRRENAYAELARCLEWERANIDRLIRSARTDRPMRVFRTRRTGRAGSAG